MDPASIVGLVAACSSLTKQCASVVKSLHGLIEIYRSAELIILSVATECETIQFAWGRIETWAQQQLHHVDDFEDIGARLQKSIYCGELVMSSLEEDLLGIISKSGSLGRGIGLTWNNSVLNEHQHRIRGQVAALQLLLQVLSLPRKEDRTEVLSVKESVFSESDESALSIVPSDRSTRYSLDGNRLSIISDDGDIQYIRFSFEDALFTSHVYKRNYRFPAMRTKSEVQPHPVLQENLSPRLIPKDAELKAAATVAQYDEADEEFFQDEMAQFHNDLFTGDTVEDDISQSQTNASETGSSRDSDSDASDMPTIHPISPETNIGIFEPANDDSAQPIALRDLPAANEAQQKESEREKKTRLSRALQKANTAVLLDNAQNFEGAMEAYKSACILLGEVIVRSRGEEDRKKLNAIRETYRDRIKELASPPAAKNEDVVVSETEIDEGISEIQIGQAI